MRPYDTVPVGKHSLPCTFNGSFQLLKISVTIIYSVYNVVTQSSFSVTQRQMASGGKWMFCYYVTMSHMNLGR